MATPTWASVLDALKEDYKDEITQLPERVFMLAQLKKNSDDVVGRRARHVIQTSRGTGHGSRQPGGTLPEASRAGWKAVNIPVRMHYVVVQFPRHLMKAMSKDRGTFIDGIDREMQDGLTGARMRLNRQSWGTSDGVIATCGTTSASTTVVLATTTTETQLRHLENAKVDIGTVADPDLIASGRTISSVDYTNKTVVVSGAAVTTSSSHRLFWYGEGGASDDSGDENDGQSVLTGATDAIDDTNVLHTLDPATYTVWKSRVYSNSGTDRAWSESLVNRAIHRGESDSDSTIDLLVSNFWVWEEAANDMRAMRRNVDSVRLKGGAVGIPWTLSGSSVDGPGEETSTYLAWERDCPQKKLFGIASEDIVLYQMSDEEWVDDDGSILSRVPNQDEFEAYLAWYAELGWKRRNSMFVIEDLAEAA